MPRAGPGATGCCTTCRRTAASCSTASSRRRRCPTAAARARTTSARSATAARPRRRGRTTATSSSSTPWTPCWAWTPAPPGSSCSTPCTATTSPRPGSSAPTAGPDAEGLARRLLLLSLAAPAEAGAGGRSFANGGRAMPSDASPEREKEYEELKERFEEEGRYPGREEEVAARIVNKQRSEFGETREALEQEARGQSPDRDLPIEGYQHLTVAEVVGRLDALSPEQVEQVRQYEQAHRNRKTLLRQLERRLRGGRRQEVAQP